MTTRIAALAAIATLLITACSRNAPPAAKASPTQMPPASSVTWTSCSGFQCGTVKVPLDYAHPDAGTIGIALIRKPATDSANRIGSVLINPGGPGVSGIEFLRGEAASMTNLNRRLDLIGFDPRGVGQSAPVRCLQGTQADAFNAIDSVLDDPQEKAAAIQANKDYTAACRQQSASVLPFVDTVSAAGDLDLMRQALGDAKLTYLGFSYGTFLGETYANLFPTHVRALSLDGVLDPSISFNDLLLAQVVGFEQNLQAFIADCKARMSGSSPCTYGRSGDPNAKLVALMQRLDGNPLPVGTRQLTRALAMTGVLVTLYDPSTWKYLDLALTKADQGDGTVLLALADFYLGRNADGSYSNQTDANWAINCLDHPVPSDISAYDQLQAAFAKASPLFGPWSQYSNVTCAYWPVKPTRHEGALTANGAPPILLVGGTDDPATPYAWAQAVNRQMSNSVLLTRKGNGHVSYDKSTCAKNAEDDYLISLTVPSSGVVCS